MQLEGGKSILKLYNWSMYQLLIGAFPEYNWLPWRYMSSKDYWDEVGYAKGFLDAVATQLDIKNVSDWKKIKIEVRSIFRGVSEVKSK